MSTDWPFDPETGELMEAAPSNVTEISVSELSFALKRTLEEGFSHVRVRGELSRVSRPASGHCSMRARRNSPPKGCLMKIANRPFPTFPM